MAESLIRGAKEQGLIWCEEEEVDRENAFDLYTSMGPDPYSFLLHHERGSLMGHNPFLVFKSKGEKIWLKNDLKPIKTFTSQDPLLELEKLFTQYQTSYSPRPFFQGGMVGYFGYDLARRLEKLPLKCLDDEEIPDILVGFYDRTHICDLSREAHFQKKYLQKESFFINGGLRSNFTKEKYLAAVRSAKDYIAQGDIYQVNLSQRFKTTFEGDSFQLFRELAQNYPAPYASYFHTPELTLISLSPERFLRANNQIIQTCPIKGTRPRGTTPEKDLALRAELIKSAKDAAELLMIIDLERNDLGKVCEYGSVQVLDAKRLEEHPTLHHLVGTVEGKLKPGLSHFDCLRAMFPGGSITGVPKIRAMEIIEELEPTRRNIYTGVFGYMGFNGITDLSILIRTLVQKKEYLSFQVGSGIVADSVPETEYKETLVKGRAFFEVLQPHDHTLLQR